MKIESNIRFVEKIDTLGDDSMLSGENIDLSLLDATRSLKYEILDEDQLCQDIDELGYYLTLLNGSLAVGLEMTFSGTFLALSESTRIRGLHFVRIGQMATQAKEFATNKQIVQRLNEIAGNEAKSPPGPT